MRRKDEKKNEIKLKLGNERRMEINENFCDPAETLISLKAFSFFFFPFFIINFKFLSLFFSFISHQLLVLPMHEFHRVYY